MSNKNTKEDEESQFTKDHGCSSRCNPDVEISQVQRYSREMIRKSFSPFVFHTRLPSVVTKESGGSTTFVTVGKVPHHSRSLLRSDGRSPQVDNAVVIVVVVVVGDLVLILEVTGKDNPAALIATLSGIVMNG